MKAGSGDDKNAQMSSSGLSIAIVGTRGVPGRYGGFETFAEQLSKRLAERGHNVTVFGRTSRFPWSREEPLGAVNRISSWTLNGKHLETPLASLSAFIYLLFHRVDVILLCNAANSIFGFFPLLTRTPLAVNVDGVERKRSKWGFLGRAWYRFGELFSLLYGTEVVSDAYCIAEYYASEYGVSTNRIAYGALASVEGSSDVLERFGVEENRYLLYVSRLEPENNALGVVRAYLLSGVELPLVVVGDAPHAGDYIRSIHDLATSESDGPGQVIFTGYQFGEDYHALQRNCRCYIQATEVGGTHPALIEAMAHGNAIIANGVPEHFEVVGGAGVYYPRNDFARLAELMAELSPRERELEELGGMAKERAAVLFNWETITDRYENLLSNMLK